MPVQYAIDAAARLVTYKAVGDPTADEMRRFFDAVISDPDFRAGFGFVGDRRGVPADAPASYVQSVAALLRERAADLAPCRWAIVLPTEDGFAAVRVCALMVRSAGVTVTPFTSFTRAREWARAGQQA